MKRYPLASLLAGTALAAALGLSLPGNAVAADDSVAPAPTSMPALAARDPREPSRVQVSWELTFKHGPLERIIMNVDGKDTPYWYMRYTIINNSGRDVLFTPNFEIVAESGVVIPAFKSAPTVFDKIKSLYGNPLLLAPINMDGKLLQGDDNAKDGVAIFPALDPDSRNYQIFVTGLSGETSEVQNPMTKKPVILQKTLELDYNIPGQAIGIPPVTKLNATKWVMK